MMLPRLTSFDMCEASFTMDMTSQLQYYILHINTNTLARVCVYVCVWVYVCVVVVVVVVVEVVQYITLANRRL